MTDTPYRVLMPVYRYYEGVAAHRLQDFEALGSAVRFDVPIKILAAAEAVKPTADYGQFWAKDEGKGGACTAWFSNDAGAAVQLGLGGAHALRHGPGGADALRLDDLATPQDNTDLNSGIVAHGLCPKLPNQATKYLNGVGDWATPAGSGTGSMTTVKWRGAQVGDADIVTLDFASGFAVSESPDTEINIAPANMAAYTIKMRNSVGAGVPQDVKISALTKEASPAAGDWVFGETAGGALCKIDVGDIGGGSSLPVVDTTAIVKDTAAPTKLMRIDVGAVTAGQTRVLSMGDADLDLATAVTAAAALTNAALVLGDGSRGIASATVGIEKLTATQTNVFFGRDTAGAGPGEELSVVTVKSSLLGIPNPVNSTNVIPATAIAVGDDGVRKVKASVILIDGSQNLTNVGSFSIQNGASGYQDHNGRKLLTPFPQASAANYNYLLVANEDAGSAPGLYAFSGGDAAVDINMVPFGSGHLQEAGTDVSLSGHSHTESDISDLTHYTSFTADFAAESLANLTTRSVNNLSDVSGLSAITGETGSGNLVRATSPTIVTPVIASFATAQHAHLAAASGGLITDASWGRQLTGTLDCQYNILNNWKRCLGKADGDHCKVTAQAYGNTKYASWTSAKYGGSLGTPTAVASGQEVGRFSFFGYDGAAIQARVILQVLVTGAVSGGVVPMDLVCKVGTSAATERWRTQSDGHTLVASSNRWNFRDANQYIGSSAANHLDLDAADTLTLRIGGTRELVVENGACGFNGVAAVAPETYNLSNENALRTMDISAISDADLRRVVGTIIRDQISNGLFASV